jgi:hypothetical protein
MINKNYLQQLVDKASSSNVNIEIGASKSGLNVTISRYSGGLSEGVTTTTSFWIDKNESDMEGRMNHFIELVQNPKRA